LLSKEQLNVVGQRALIAFEREHIIGALVAHLGGNLFLATHRINGDDSALDREQIKQFRNCSDLVRLVGDLALAEHHPLTERLAFDGDDIGAKLVERRDPGDETSLERFCFEGREQMAELVVRWRALSEDCEPPQDLQLPLAECGALDPTLRARDHDQ
jgi:hypothetical protein